MTIGLILKRMRREWRSLAVLLLAVCLLTGFFALGPFYIRAVTDVGLRYELDNAAPEDLQITLIVDNEPLTAESYGVVQDELGDLARDYAYYIRADYTPPTTEGGQAVTTLATNGYIFRYGEQVTASSTRTGNFYQPFAFEQEQMEQYLTLVEGRWPVRLAPPSEVNPAGLSDLEQQARGVGIYSRGDLEVIVTRAVADQVNLEVGSRLTLGSIQRTGEGNVASVVVVGIVEPKDTSEPFWSGNFAFLEGMTVEVGFLTRYDYGLATIPSAYEDWLADVVPGSSHIYVIDTRTEQITADNIQDVNDRLQKLQNRLSAYHPGIAVLSGLTTVLQSYSGDVSDTEGPIIFLSGAILILMLYHLVNTVALVLEQQGAEWSTIVSRGGSIPQLVMLQLVTVGFLALIGMAAGPFLSLGFMKLMEHFGPLATALGGQSLTSVGIPTVSLYLSAGAALAALLVLTLPALPAARKSLLALKQLVSRPPTRPGWARFGLDGILLAIGAALMLRLYYLVGGDLGDLLNNLFAAPREVVKLIADNLNETGGLKDPFNLLGPALVLTGAALVWLRLFPWLMGLIARGFERTRHLTTPLAVWNVARDPGHYAQLVLLLIGTLALGTASLGLSATLDRGAWGVSREETGGSARVSVNTARLDASEVDWDDLPGVSSSVTVLHAVGDPGSQSRRDVHVFGVMPDAIPADFDVLASASAPLGDVATPPAPGLELPEDASLLSVQVYSLPQENADDPAVAVALTAYLQDVYGVPYRVQLRLPDATATSVAPGVDTAQETDDAPEATPVDTWLTFSGSLPEQGRAPYRLTRIGLNSTAGNLDVFTHTIYVDRVATQDAFGTSRTLDGFEDDRNVWAEASVANPYAGSWASETNNVSRVRGVTLSEVSGEVAEIDGPNALRLDYRMGKIGGREAEPSIVVNEVTVDRIPVVINRAFAELFTGRGTYRTAADEPLEVGDAKSLVLNVGTGSVEIGYVVAGVIDDLPSVDARDPVMIAPYGLIQPVLNQAAISSSFFAGDEVWLELPDREPSGALEDTVGALDGVDEVAWAWTRYGQLQREPLPNAVTGMLYAGFWISLLLSLLDFGFYLMVTARQRMYTFGVLRSMGWNASHIWRLLFIEQVVLIAPALVIGSAIGAGLAYLLLPFMALVGSESLRLPWLQLLGMLAALVVSFGVLLGVAAIFLRRMSVNQVLRLGEE